MPTELANFIDLLVTYAQSHDVDSQQLFESLRDRQFGIAISKVIFDFDSKPSSNKTLQNFVSDQPFRFTQDAFDANSRQLITTDVLKAMVDFINDPDGDYHFTKKAKEARVFDPSRLDLDDETRARKIALMGNLINNSINFDKTNNFGRTSLKVGETSSPFPFFQDLAQKLVNMKSPQDNRLTQTELEALGNSDGRGRGGFIDWLVKVAADAARDDKYLANSVGIKKYDDLLKVINNIQLLSKN